ncbi:hypothetical protein OH76DRAFT_1479240 [Lentinus brumalis]|uniref:Uncharacterized protein n=1 Tax=Lentinus brumalis TaxID=2498619 RepID=A0A371DNZ3_9APHY|nr:hypothetical protein OH76DRAFT_1479240 [Polyporus brumalis]
MPHPHSLQELLKEAIEEGFKPTESLKEGEPPGYDTMRAPEQFPHVSAWTRTKFTAKMGKNTGTVKVGAITSARGHTLIARGINSTAQYLEHTDGTLADAHYMTQARDICKALLNTAEACGHSLPREWKDVDPRLVAIFVNALRTLSVLHQLSLDNFKAHKTFTYVYYETRTRKALASSSKSLLDHAPFTIDDRSTPAPSASSLPPSGFTFTTSTLPAKKVPEAPRASSVPDPVPMLPSIVSASSDIRTESDIPIDPTLQLATVFTGTPAHAAESNPSSSSSTSTLSVEPPASTSSKRPALDAMTDVETAPAPKRQNTTTTAPMADSVVLNLTPQVRQAVIPVSTGKDKAQETPVTDTSFDLLDMEPRPLPNALADYLAPIAPGTRVTTAPDSLLPGASSKRSGKARASRKPTEWPPTATTPKWLYASEWYEKEQGTLDAFEVHWNALPQDEKTKTIPARMKKKKLPAA